LQPEPFSHSIEHSAALFAQKAHESIGQIRKYSQQPYFEHPARVAAMVKNREYNSQMVAAAYLHDVVEDVPFEAIWDVYCIGKGKPRDSVAVLGADDRSNKLCLIRDFFGEYVALLVEQLSDVSVPSDGNRATRKQIDREHLAKACPEAKTIKLADLIDNAKDIATYAPEFARIFFDEMNLLLPVLKEGDKNFHRDAKLLVDDFLGHRASLGFS
jgi:(p)ppGpp synthase/HD superfamily hydrolase